MFDPFALDTPQLAQARAREAVVAGDEDTARSLWQAHGNIPECAIALRERALLARDAEAARAWLEPSAAASASEAEVARGIACMLEGRPQEALAHFDAALALEPDSPTACHHQARALFNLGHREEAVRRLQALAARAPDRVEVRCSLAHALRALGRFDEAASHYRAATRAAPGLYAAWFQLGLTELLRERPEPALAAFDRGSRQGEQDPEWWLNRGLALHMAGRPGAAAECYRRVIAMRPEHAVGHYYLGALLNELLDTEGAERHLRRARELDPDDADAAVELIGLLEQSNRLDEAAALLEGAVQRHPGHARLHLEQARLARRQGRLPAARAALARIAPQGLLPRDAQAYWFERAQLHDRMDEPEAALAALAAGHQLAARSPRRQHIDPGAFGRRIARLAHWLDAHGGMLRAGHPEPLPPLPFELVFLVGLPRSGTTLIDTLLDAQEGVASIE